jgi:MYXO-CTERM domain-containing protein
VGGNGAFVNEPTPSTVMDFLTTTSTIMNVPAGFDTGFATYYASTYAVGSITIYDGLNGTGTLLATIPLAALGSDPLGGGIPGAYNIWALVGVGFSGTAHSAVFSANDFDAMTFDNVTIGSTVPAPAAAGLLGLSGLVALRRRR